MAGTPEVEGSRLLVTDEPPGEVALAGVEESRDVPGELLDDDSVASVAVDGPLDARDTALR